MFQNFEIIGPAMRKDPAESFLCVKRYFGDAVLRGEGSC